jgi:hypothetical protein
MASTPAPHPPGRNETCRCGSGRKYKQCCLDKDEAAAAAARAKAARQAEKAEKAREPAEAGKTASGAEKEPGPPAPGAGPPGKRRGATNQPWKKPRGGAHPAQRKSLPRKVGGG